MALSGMRGLSVFISDIRNCHNKEQERLRVDKELGNIRTRFKNEKGLSPYEKKKYVWKMLYIYMLGYDVDFGHMETVSLISAPKYPEKQVGYIVTSCLLNENNDFLRMVINTVRNDIIGRNETYQCLALTMVGNIGGKEFSESLAPDVQKLLISSSCRPVVRKKAALCLLRLYRKNPDVVNIDGWSDRMAQLLDERDLGVLTSVMSLFVSLVSNNAEAYWNCLPKCVRILERMARNQDIPQEYTYYGIPSPWLQVKTMRALQYFPTIEDPGARRALFEVLQRILMGTDVVKNVNKNNASHAVLFEALALVMHLDAEKEMMSQCVALLGKFIAVREPNIRYLGLENMSRMLLVTDVQDIIKRHQAQIITSLKDPDISIRRRALDLLYGMCDVT
ncbi:Os03g0112101, partial [Oryza sativa Japonica Group]